MDSQPFCFGLHLFTAFFGIEDVDPDSLCFSFLHNRLSGSPPVTLKIVHVHGACSALTLDSAGHDGGSFPAPSRELHAQVPPTTSRSSRCQPFRPLMLIQLLVPLYYPDIIGSVKEPGAKDCPLPHPCACQVQNGELQTFEPSCINCEVPPVPTPP